MWSLFYWWLMKFKRCKHCGDLLQVFSFKLTVNSDDGRFPICEECVDEIRNKQIQNWNRYHGRL